LHQGSLRLATASLDGNSPCATLFGPQTLRWFTSRGTMRNVRFFEKRVQRYCFFLTWPNFFEDFYQKSAIWGLLRWKKVGF